jgi:hypothetical protein
VENASRGSESVRRALAAALLAVCAFGGGFGGSAMPVGAAIAGLAAGVVSMLSGRMALLPAQRGGRAVGLAFATFAGSVWLAARPLPAVFAAMLGAGSVAAVIGLVVAGVLALRARPALPALRLVD